MSLFTALLGAFALTYLVSRIGIRVIPQVAPKLSGKMMLFAAHMVCFLVLGLFSAMLKANQETLLESAMLIYLAPQVIWLLLDLYVRPGQVRRR